MIVVSLCDNVLGPVVIGRGLPTPMPVIVVGVFGGTLSYGIGGLFLGPIVLSLAWALVAAWVNDDNRGTSASDAGQVLDNASGVPGNPEGGALVAAGGMAKTTLMHEAPIENQVPEDKRMDQLDLWR
jgi:hypothetical protein